MMERYLWPPRHMMIIEDVQSGGLVSRTTHRDMDLGLHLECAPKDLYLSVMSRSRSRDWQRWDDATVGRVEFVIKADLGYDGYQFRLRRSTRCGKPCNTWFRWRLRIDRPRQD
jgi:hypothetical protein